MSGDVHDFRYLDDISQRMAIVDFANKLTDMLAKVHSPTFYCFPHARAQVAADLLRRDRNVDRP